MYLTIRMMYRTPEAVQEEEEHEQQGPAEQVEVDPSEAMAVHPTTIIIPSTTTADPIQQVSYTTRIEPCSSGLLIL